MNKLCAKNQVEIIGIAWTRWNLGWTNGERGEESNEASHG
jgi:hypothetical protein